MIILCCTSGVFYCFLHVRKQVLRASSGRGSSVHPLPTALVRVRVVGNTPNNKARRTTHDTRSLHLETQHIETSKPLEYLVSFAVGHDHRVARGDDAVVYRLLVAILSRRSDRSSRLVAIVARLLSGVVRDLIGE